MEVSVTSRPFRKLGPTDQLTDHFTNWPSDKPTNYNRNMVMMVSREMERNTNFIENVTSL